MTTFQDPPLHSRRAVRHSETDQAEVDAVERPASPRTGRRAQLPSATEWRAEDGAASSAPAPAASEPFVLTTQTLAKVPVVAHTAVSHPLADEDATERPRVSSGRRASLPAGEQPQMVIAQETDIADNSAKADDADATPADTTPADTTPADTEAVDTTVTDNVEDHTDVVPDVISAEPDASSPVGDVDVTDAIAPFVPAERELGGVEDTATTDRVAATETPVAAEPVVERTLTRRELRELRVAAERAAEQEVPEAIVSILNSGPIILPYLSSGPTRRSATDSPDGTDGVAGDDGPTAAPASTWGTPISPAMAVESPDLDADDDLATDGADPHAGDATPAPVESESSPASARSAGHWSVRPDTDGEIESLEGSISRSVGANGALATNALVLPSIPQSSDITSPFTASGEIMATGSFDLPRSLASTGAHPSRVDTSDFDLDPLDRDVPTTDSAPVRAIRAISTHTGSNGMVSTKKQSNRTLTVLVITASTIALGVAGAIVLSVTMNLFP